MLSAVALVMALPTPLSSPPEPTRAAAPQQRETPAESVSPARAAVTVAPALPAAPLRVAATAAPRLADDEAEVCGLGVVRIDDESPLPQHLIPDNVRALALQRLGLAMAASRDERLRAADMLLRARLAVAPEALAGAADADAACRRARDSGLEETARFCVEEQARSQLALLEPAAAAVDQLARMAAMSGDPQIYAFAFEACNPGGLSFHGRDGNCQLVTPEQWARLAPADAEPWLHLAAQAQAVGDAPAVSAALGRAAQAQTLGANAAAPLALAAGALPEGMPVLEQTAVLVAFGALDAGAVPIGLEVVDTACNESALHDAARRQACGALARMLVERGRLSTAVTVGVQLGERLGWPADRTGAMLREQRAALDAAMRFASGPQPLACDNLQRRRELVMLTGQFGDIGAGRELLRRERAAQRPTRAPRTEQPGRPQVPE